MTELSCLGVCLIVAVVVIFILSQRLADTNKMLCASHEKTLRHALAINDRELELMKEELRRDEAVANLSGQVDAPQRPDDAKPVIPEPMFDQTQPYLG